MTTYTQFSPSSTAPFQFQPTLGGNVYTLVVTWNIFGQRWYLNLYTSQQVPLYCAPLTGSPPDYNISILPPMDPTTGLPWTSTMCFREATQTFEVSP
jgi:hypothetical protein